MHLPSWSYGVVVSMFDAVFTLPYLTYLVFLRYMELRHIVIRQDSTQKSYKDRIIVNPEYF